MRTCCFWLCLFFVWAFGSPAQAVDLLSPLKTVFSSVGEGLFGEHVRRASASIDGLARAFSELPANTRKELEPLINELRNISKDLLKEANAAAKDRIEQAKDAGQGLLGNARKSALLLLERAESICQKLLAQVDQRLQARILQVDQRLQARILQVDQRLQARILQVQATIHSAIHQLDVVLGRFLAKFDTVLKESIGKINRALKDRIAQVDRAWEQRVAQMGATLQSLTRDALAISNNVSGRGHHLLASLANIAADFKVSSLGLSVSFAGPPAIQTILPDLVFRQRKEAQEATFIVRHIPSLSKKSVRPYVKRAGHETPLEIVALDAVSLRVRLPASLPPGEYLVGLKNPNGQEIVPHRLISLKKENSLVFEGAVFHPLGEAKTKATLEPGMLRDKQLLSFAPTSSTSTFRVKFSVFDPLSETGTLAEFQGPGSRTFPLSGLQLTIDLRKTGEALSLLQKCIDKRTTSVEELWSLNPFVAKGTASEEQIARWQALLSLHILRNPQACFHIREKSPTYGLFLTMFRLAGATPK